MRGSTPCNVAEQLADFAIRARKESPCAQAIRERATWAPGTPDLLADDGEG